MFFSEFNAFLKDLNTNPVTDEWYMADFIEKHIKTLKSYEAFDILKDFVDYMIEEYDSRSEYEIIEALRYLKLQAGTAEKFYSNEQKAKIIELYQKDYSQNALAELL